ncbi:hypothetical protein Q428_04985 [Fervidicella metallireducens AeB]|uniref:Lysine exporter LysO family protein n=1 Tax=Fervidicella metallireducens AeB TaxID=1403537 RepID=A0A017RWF1_9CLOT|nr:LysO family transporter [Fervidicella metallireducens]EYE88997.1 hypothetical protein Q428_04985 [Fervidicella metallireducens AeB]
MWLIIVSLFLGVVIGILNFIPQKYIKYNSKFQQIGVVLLLFSMGASIGSNKRILNNFSQIGLKSIVFAVFTSIFSIIIVYIVSLKLMGGDEKK